MDNCFCVILSVALRKEFEVDSRFKDISRKLESLKENTKYVIICIDIVVFDAFRFFVEIVHSNTSNRLENLIIILIGCEIVIGIIGLVMHYMLSDHHDREEEKKERNSN